MDFAWSILIKQNEQGDKERAYQEKTGCRANIKSLSENWILALNGSRIRSAFG
jgi:hypothetical protein